MAISVCDAWQILGAHYEDPPLFTSETTPACGQSIRQGIGVVFKLWNRYLGDQWTVGDYKGMMAAARNDLPPRLQPALASMQATSEDPPQNLKEYDPEWGRAFWTGSVGASCDHETMLSSVKCPVLFTHHFRKVDESGYLLGAISDVQSKRVQELIDAAGQQFEYRSFPTMGHSMHGQDPALFAKTLIEWASSLPK